MAVIHLTHLNILYMCVIQATAQSSAFRFKGTMKIEIPLELESNYQCDIFPTRS